MAQMPLKVWNRYISDGSVKLGETTLRESGLLFQQAHLRALIRAEELVPLLVEQEGRLLVMPASEDWQVGDRIIYLLHDPRPKLLKRLSGGIPQTRLAIEKLSEVEEIPIPAAPLAESLAPLPLETPEAEAAQSSTLS